MILVFDTETSGLPKSFGAPASDTRNWPHVVQLAWAVFDINGREISRNSSLVRPDGFTIDGSASAVHGITEERARTEGEAISDVLARFSLDLQRHAPVLVAHNYSFDRNVLGAAYLRTGGKDPFEGRPWVCTMESAAPYFPTPGGKWPKLDELYRGLTGAEMVGAHDALCDVMATSECFFELKKRGLRVPLFRTRPKTSKGQGAGTDLGDRDDIGPHWPSPLVPIWERPPAPPLDILFSSFEYREIGHYEGPLPAPLYRSHFQPRPDCPDLSRTLGESADAWRNEPRPAPQHAQRAVAEAVKLSEAGDHDGAIEHLLTAYELDGQNETTLFRLGYVHYEKGAFDEAVRWYRARLNRGEEGATANNLAIALAKLGDSEGAAAMAHKAALLTDRPAHHRAAGGRALAFLPFVGTIEGKLSGDGVDAGSPEAEGLLQHAENAAYHYERVIELEPSARDRSQLAKALYKLGRVDWALDLLRAAREEEPDAPGHASATGDVLYGEGRWEEAAEAYTAALSLRPDFAYASFARGRCYRSLRHWPEALSDFERAADLAPEKPAYERLRKQAEGVVDEQKRKEKARIEAEQRRAEEAERRRTAELMRTVRALQPPPEKPKPRPVFWKTTHFVAVPMFLLFLFAGMVESPEDLGMLFLVSYTWGIMIGGFRWMSQP